MKILPRQGLICYWLLIAFGAFLSLAPAYGQTSGAAPTSVPRVAVEGTPEDLGEPDDGSAVDGYRVHDSTAAGPVIGKQSQQDTPYSISVMPQPLIENVQAPNADRLFELNPYTQSLVPASRGFNTLPQIRGFTADQFFESGRDAGPYEDLEDKERVEVINGLTGFLYGGTFNPGGVVNYVLKRPTPTGFVSVTVGDYDTANFFGHLDAGGPIGSAGVFGYRINALIQGGHTSVDDQRVDRKLISGAFDIHPAESLLLQFDASYSRHRTDGIIPVWFTGSAPQYPPAPDADRDWGQKFTFMDAINTHAGFNIAWTPVESIGFRGSIRYSTSGYSSVYTNNSINDDDTYDQSIFYEPRDKVINYAGYAMFDLKFRTFGIANKLTAGFYGDRSELDFPLNGFQFLGSIPGVSFESPQYIAPLFGSLSARGEDDVVSHRNYVVADEIRFWPMLTGLVGVTEAQISEIDFDTTSGDETYNYDKNRASPAGSLIFKPVPWISAYATYIEGLEEGSQAAPTNNGLPVTNANELLAPVVDKEYEVGLKAAVGGALLTAAAFDLERQSDVYVPNGMTSFTFNDDGREVHKGIELGVTGKVTQDLTLFGGVTQMRNKITSSPDDPSLVGLRPANVANTMAKLYAEYALRAIPGLALTGNVAYVGSFFADSPNTQPLPNFTVGGMGLRYDSILYGTPASLRFNVDNIADKSYWLSSLYEGMPRTFAFAGELRF